MGLAALARAAHTQPQPQKVPHPNRRRLPSLLAEFKWHEGGTKKFLPNYCTVTYADAAGAQRARDALHGLMPRGVFKPLSVVFLPMKTGRVSETMTGVKKDGDEDDNDPLFDEFDDAGGRPGTNRAEEAERLALTAEKLDNKIGEVRAMLQELEEEEKSLEA